MLPPEEFLKDNRASHFRERLDQTSRDPPGLPILREHDPNRVGIEQCNVQGL